MIHLNMKLPINSLKFSTIHIRHRFQYIILNWLPQQLMFKAPLNRNQYKILKVHSNLLTATMTDLTQEVLQSTILKHMLKLLMVSDELFLDAVLKMTKKLEACLQIMSSQNTLKQYFLKVWMSIKRVELSVTPKRLLSIVSNLKYQNTSSWLMHLFTLLLTMYSFTRPNYTNHNLINLTAKTNKKT